MFQLDDNFLKDLGLADLPADEKDAFLLHLYEELELRVGVELSKTLSEAQLVEFERLIEKDNPTDALEWLETNCPNYKQVVDQELEKLKQEIIANRDILLGS